jgi:hypothetical protein
LKRLSCVFWFVSEVRVQCWAYLACG